MIQCTVFHTHHSRIVIIIPINSKLAFGSDGKCHQVYAFQIRKTVSPKLTISDTWEIPEFPRRR